MQDRITMMMVIFDSRTHRALYDAAAADHLGAASRKAAGRAGRRPVVQPTAGSVITGSPASWGWSWCSPRDNLASFAIVFHRGGAERLYGWHERKVTDHAAGRLCRCHHRRTSCRRSADPVHLVEATAVTSVFLILASARRGRRRHALSDRSGSVGCSFAVRCRVIFADTGSLAFGAMELGSMATWLVFIAFGFKAAFPLLNGWLQDAIPGGCRTVALSFTTTGHLRAGAGYWTTC